jgi:hypothetical protein
MLIHPLPWAGVREKPQTSLQSIRSYGRGLPSSIDAAAKEAEGIALDMSLKN